jgi:hypothetical protein
MSFRLNPALAPAQLNRDRGDTPPRPEVLAICLDRIYRNGEVVSEKGFNWRGRRDSDPISANL